MSLLFVLVATLVSVRSRDGVAILLLGAGVAVSGWRLWLLYRGQVLCTSLALAKPQALALERSFGISYVVFAALFGCFSARALMLPIPTLHLPVAILIVGYAAGAVATTALRPLIAATSVLLAVLPPAFVFATGADADHAVSALCLVALLAGGLRSLAKRHIAQVRQSATSSALAGLARRDHLTGLMNRLALVQAIDELDRSGSGAGGYALHYLDLDGFKQINDQLGHAVGDALLCAVGRRLNETISPGDVVARLGGDEFVIMQVAPSSHHAIEARAAAVARLLHNPYQVAGMTVRVGVSVGSSRRSHQAGEMDVLLEEADAALRRHKGDREARVIPYPSKAPWLSCPSPTP